MLLFASGAQAAVAFDAKGTADCTSTTATVTCSTLTIGAGGSNYALVAYVSYANNSLPTSVTATWNGTSMTRIGTLQYSSTLSIGTAVFCLPAPTSGSHPLVITINGTIASPEVHTIGASFTGADQTTPCKNATTLTDFSGTTGTLTVTSATGDIATGSWTQNFTTINTMSGTIIVTDDSGPNTGMYANYAPGAATVALTATANGSASWQGTGIDIAAAGGGGGATSAGTMMLMGVGD